MRFEPPIDLPVSYLEHFSIKSLDFLRAQINSALRSRSVELNAVHVHAEIHEPKL